MSRVGRAENRTASSGSATSAGTAGDPERVRGPLGQPGFHGAGHQQHPEVVSSTYGVSVLSVHQVATYRKLMNASSPMKCGDALETRTRRRRSVPGQGSRACGSCGAPARSSSPISCLPVQSARQFDANPVAPTPCAEWLQLATPRALLTRRAALASQLSHLNRQVHLSASRSSEGSSTVALVSRTWARRCSGSGPPPRHPLVGKPGGGRKVERGSPACRNTVGVGVQPVGHLSLRGYRTSDRRRSEPGC
jgi:hypothetical protein